MITGKLVLHVGQAQLRPIADRRREWLNRIQAVELAQRLNHAPARPARSPEEEGDKP